ncbi:metalloregulator ArsR/SmtB family transcription factor [Paenibacillus sp. HB172176]|uniref:ArsR/SmtB family transcription factor n=1 Tax=Paenibacillus sp. HB172176 TaxID=2493690 RepID=UPI001438A933|nr:metalloregulator ArsR/SmtB family transcription factor [Paenibacillus sp. HB172176]
MASIDEVAESMKLLGDKSRLSILSMLRYGEMCVCDIVAILNTTQPNVSQHLKKLKRGGLVVETRRKQWMYYALNMEDKPYLKQIIEGLPSMEAQVKAAKPQDCC